MQRNYSASYQTISPETSVIYDNTCDMSDSCQLEKVEVVGLNQMSVDGLKSFLLRMGSVTEVRLRDAGYRLTDASEWLTSMIDEGCLANVHVFNLTSTEKSRDLPGLSTEM